MKFPVVQIMGLDAHLGVKRLDGKKSYVLQEVCAFPFPSSLLGIRSGGIESLVNGLSRIEVIYLNQFYVSLTYLVFSLILDASARLKKNI